MHTRAHLQTVLFPDGGGVPLGISIDLLTQVTFCLQKYALAFVAPYKAAFSTDGEW